MIRYSLDLNELTPMNRTQIERLAHLACSFESHILLTHRNRTINGKSMLGLLSLGRTGQDEVILSVEGEDEDLAAPALKQLLDSGVAAPKSAVDAENLMQRVKQRYANILGDRLVGIYLHGSLAAGCFQWERSDIDFLVVVAEPLSIEKKIALAEALYTLSSEAPPSGFEMSVLLRQDCLSPVYPMPFELHASKCHRQEYERDARGYCERMHGVDPDLTAHILCLHAFGAALLGPGIPRVFGRIRREDALLSIHADMRDALERLSEKPCYYVLNGCRALAYLRENLVLDKREGGEWGLERLPHCYQPLIQAALNAYQDGLDMAFDLSQADEFCRDVLRELES